MAAGKISLLAKQLIIMFTCQFDVSDVLMNRTADEGGVTITWLPLRSSLEIFLKSYWR